MNYNEIEEIFCLAQNKKYEYFLTMAAESEQICGLKDNNGWITIKDESGNLAMPVWPGWNFAKYCQENQWKETQIEIIDLYEFLEYWLLGMKRDGCRVLIFGDSSGGGISVEADKLKEEIQKYLETR